MQIWSTTIKLLLDLCLSMRARGGIPVLQANSQSPWTLSSHPQQYTATPALFLAYQVFMLDARNVSGLQTNSQLYLQALIGLKICLHAMSSPTTNQVQVYWRIIAIWLDCETQKE